MAPGGLASPLLPAERPRKSSTVLRRTRSADDTSATPDYEVESAATSIIFSKVYESIGVKSDGSSTPVCLEDEGGKADHHEKDGRALDVDDRGDVMGAVTGTTISRSVTVHEPWYTRGGKTQERKQVACFNGCTDAEVVQHCNTCGMNMCLQCASKHATDAKTRCHELISYDEKKMSHLKTGGWNVKIMLGLGMNDDDTVNNLSKKFQEVRLAESVVQAFQNRGKSRGAKQGDNSSRQEETLRALAMRSSAVSSEVNGETTSARMSNYLMTGEPGMGDFVNPPSRPLGPLFRQGMSPKVKGVDPAEQIESQRHADAVKRDGSGHDDGRQSSASISDEQCSPRRTSPERKKKVLRRKKTGNEMEEEGKSPDAETSLDWRPTDESGRLMNFFDTFKATPDMRKIRDRSQWGSIKNLDPSGALHDLSKGFGRTASTDSDSSATRKSKGKDLAGLAGEAGWTAAAVARLKRTSSADGRDHMAVIEGRMSGDRPKRVNMGGRLDRTSSAEAGAAHQEGSRLSRTASNDSSQEAAGAGGKPLLAAMGRLSRTGSAESGSSKKIYSGQMTRTGSSESTGRATGSRRSRLSRTASSDSSLSAADSLRAASVISSSASAASNGVPQRSLRLTRGERQRQKESQINAPPPLPESPRNPWGRERERMISMTRTISPRQIMSGLVRTGSPTMDEGARSKSPSAISRTESPRSNGSPARSVKSSILMQKHKIFASTKGLLSVTSSLGGSRTNVKSGLLFVEYLKGDEPVCCFCEIGPKHFIISHQNDPEKVMYKVPLLELSLKLCEVSSRRLNMVSVMPTALEVKSYAMAGMKRLFDRGKCILVARDEEEIRQWHARIQRQIIDLKSLNKSLYEKYDAEDTVVYGFECRPGQKGKLRGLSKSGPLAGFNGKECTILEVESDKIQVEITITKKAPKMRSPQRTGKAAGRKKEEQTESQMPVGNDSANRPGDDPDMQTMHTDGGRDLQHDAARDVDADDIKLIRVNPENLGDVVRRELMTEAARMRLDENLASFAELLRRRYAGEDVDLDEQESDKPTPTEGLEAPTAGSSVPSEIVADRSD